MRVLNAQLDLVAGAMRTDALHLAALGAGAGLARLRRLRLSRQPPVRTGDPPAHRRVDHDVPRLQCRLVLPDDDRRPDRL
ncbi:MAG: hypothetical protein WDM81_20825 [Rhizomicrobium sp.]